MYNVLIVEDNIDVAKLYSDVLSQQYTSETVTTIKDANGRLLNQSLSKIDVLILDLLLPNGHGIDVIRKFTWQFHHIPLVVITADQSINIEKAIEAGAESVLIKGEFANSDMIRSVREAIPRHRVRWQLKPLEDEAKYLRDEMQDVYQQLIKLEQLCVK